MIRHLRLRARLEPLVASTERSLAHGTAWIMLAQSIRLIFQTVYFVVLARTLGVDSFGALAAAAAVVGVFVPFASWGFGNVLVMDVARTPAVFPTAYGSALLSIGFSSLLLVPLTIAIGALLLPEVPILAFVFLAIADLCVARIVDLAAPAFQAINRLGATAFATLLVPAVRCAAALAFAAGLGVTDLVTWTALYLAGTMAAAVVSTVYIRNELGSPVFALSAVRGRTRIGGYFAVSASASTIYADIDKMMLGRLSSFDAAGIYAAADRAVGMAFMPMTALLTAAYPRFFRAGVNGIAGSAAYARRLTGPSVAYSIFAGIGIFMLAPLAPIILGSDFDASVGALRWLAPMPLLSSLAYLPADALTGADAQGLRTLLQLSAAVLNIALNLLLIPGHSWLGAAWSTLISVGALALALWVSVLVLERRERRSPPTRESGDAARSPVEGAR